MVCLHPAGDAAIPYLHENVAGSLGLLAVMHEEREDFLAARKAHQEVLAIQRKLRGERHWQVADAGLALEGVERLARLEPAERRWLREAEQLNERGVQLYQQGKGREQILLTQNALEIRKRVLGKRHPAYAESLDNLAALYDSQGEYARAEPLYQKALEIRQQVLGDGFVFDRFISSTPTRFHRPFAASVDETNGTSLRASKSWPPW